MAEGRINKYMPTVQVFDDTMTSSTQSDTAEYYVVGNGFVLVCAASYAGTTSGYGSYRVQISVARNLGESDKGGHLYSSYELVMAKGSRWATSTTQQLGASAAVPIQVNDGDMIRIYLNNTKGTSKNLYRRFLCFGCSITTDTPPAWEDPGVTIDV